MKRGEMTQDRLEKLLLALPPLLGKVSCYTCEADDNVVPAVIRDPVAGDYLCCRCAVKRSLIAKHDIELAVRWRRFFIAHPMECSYCASSAQRHCSYCATPLCEEDRVYIPRTGCACPDCAAELEEEQRRRDGQTW